MAPFSGQKERGISPEGWGKFSEKHKKWKPHYAEPFGGLTVGFTMGATTLAALFGLFSGQNNLTDSVEVAAAWLNKSQGTKLRILV